MADPSNKVCPNFTLDCYQPMHDALMAHAENAQQVLENMVQMWTMEHNQQVATWNEQQHIEAMLAEEANGVRLLQEREDNEAEKERAEAEKRKPKMNDFNDKVEVRDVIIPCPFQYTVLKLKNFEFVELWYFSPEGCRDAVKTSTSTMEDTFSISKVDDCDIPISDCFCAKNSFLVHVKYMGWLKKHINALAEFFWHLENHLICNRRHGDTVMLLYAHCVCWSWHNNLKHGTAFNISKVNNTLMNAFNKEVVDLRRDEVLHKAS
ncbi:hypothetical protein PAXRUDRAFT_100519, partial [Paxillus rubicundulus Ve08.2h10]